MCRRVDCPKCGRPTYAGCGAHIEQVLGDVPPADRCRCRDEVVKASQEDKAAAPTQRSWLRALLGR
jgi:hypothetical protein